MATEFTFEEEKVSEIVTLFEGCLQGVAIDNLSKRLEQLNYIREAGEFAFNCYLAQIFTRRHDIKEEVRLAAGIYMKTNLKVWYKRMEKNGQTFCQTALVEALGDKKRSVREIAGSGISYVVANCGGIKAWDENSVDVVAALCKIVSSTGTVNRRLSGLRTISKVAEDALSSLEEGSIKDLLAASVEVAADPSSSMDLKVAATHAVASIVTHPSTFAPGSTAISAVVKQASSLFPLAIQLMADDTPALNLEAARLVTAMGLSGPLMRHLKPNLETAVLFFTKLAKSHHPDLVTAAAQFWTVVGTLDDAVPMLKKDFPAALDALYHAAISVGPGDAPEEQPHPWRLHYRTQRSAPAAFEEPEEAEAGEEDGWEIDDEIAGAGADRIEPDEGEAVESQGGSKGQTAQSSALMALCALSRKCVDPCVATVHGFLTVSAAHKMDDAHARGVMNVVGALAAGCSESKRFGENHATDLIDLVLKLMVSHPSVGSSGCKALSRFAPYLVAGGVGAAKNIGKIVPVLLKYVKDPSSEQLHLSACTTLAALLDACKLKAAEEDQVNDEAAEQSAKAEHVEEAPRTPTRIGTPEDRVYLQEHKIPEMLEGLVRSLLLSKPADPVRFLCDNLSAKLKTQPPQRPRSDSTYAEPTPYSPGIVMLTSLLPDLTKDLSAALSSYQTNMAFAGVQACSLIAILDLILAVADFAGDALVATSDASISVAVKELISVLISVWVTLPVGSKLKLPAAAALKGVCGATPSLIQGFADQIVDGITAALTHGVAGPISHGSGEAVVSGLDLLSALADAEGDQFASIVQRRGLLKLFGAVIEWVSPEVVPNIMPGSNTRMVLQSVTGFIGDLSRSCFSMLGDSTARYLDLMIQLLPLPHEPLINNCTWAVGELAFKMGHDGFNSYCAKLVPIFIKIINDPPSVPIAEVCSITLGRIAAICPEAIASRLPHFVSPWAAAIASVEDRPEKEEAFSGILPLLTAQISTFFDQLPAVADTLVSWKEPPASVSESATALLAAFRRHMGDQEFEEQIQLLDEEVRTQLKARFSLE